MPLTTEQRFLKKLYRWSFWTRFSVGVFGWFATVYLRLPFLQDALAYEELGAGVARDWLSGRASSYLQYAPETSPRLLIVMIGCFYVLTLGVRLLPLLIAAYSALTAFAPGYVYRIAKQIGASERAARISAWLVAITPAFAFWSGALYKEGMILLVLGILIHHALRLQSDPSSRSLRIVMASIVAMFLLRFYLAAILVVMIGLGLTQGRRTRGAPLRHLVMIRQALLVFVFAVVAAVLASNDQVQKVIPLDIADGLSQIQSSRADLAAASSGYLPDADVSTPQKALQFLPVGTAYFLVVPLPWQIGSMRQNMGIPDTAFWILLYPFVILGILRAAQRNFPAVLLILGVTLATCCLYGLFIGNIGTAYRLRIQVWFLWAPFVGMGWEAIQRRRHRTAARQHRMPVPVSPAARAQPESASPDAHQPTGIGA